MLSVVPLTLDSIRAQPPIVIAEMAKAVDVSRRVIRGVIEKSPARINLHQRGGHVWCVFVDGACQRHRPRLLVKWQAFFRVPDRLSRQLLLATVVAAANAK
jgi:hypothetical protein